MSNESKKPVENNDMDVADVFDNPEPWTKDETKLVLWSFAAALVSLVVFGYLVNKFILHAF